MLLIFTQTPIVFGGVDFSVFRIIPEGERRTENAKVAMT
jgi:hypothetical protein